MTRSWIAPGSTVGEIEVAAPDGGELYVFDYTGRHQRTLDALTGAVRYRFGYDAAHHLATVRDVDGNPTTIERDGAGTPTAIVGPFGQRTTLATDGNGYLSRMQDPNGDGWSFGYDGEGLLTGETHPH